MTIISKDKVANNKHKISKALRNVLAVIIITTMILTGNVLNPALTGNSSYMAYAITTPPEITAESGIVIDINSGEVLYNKNMDVRHEPASMTKMMTCILALENLDPDQIVKIDVETSFTGGSRIYLIEDEEISVWNLLHALMLESANDAAVALAKAVAGSVSDFADMMNAKAKELGCTDTHFVNPNGLHEDDHYSTCHDMALIAQYCMKNDTFRELVTTYKFTISETNKQPERYMYNTNRLIYDYTTKVDVRGERRYCKYDGCTGIKTGYTPQAGGCLTSGARSYDTEIISVVMASTDLGRFADTIAMFDWTFENYHAEKAVAAGEVLGTAKVVGGAVKTVGLKTAGDSYILLPAEASSAVLKTEQVLDEKIKAPVKAGDKVGVINVYEGDDIVDTVDILATENVEKGTILSYVGIENKTAYIIFGVGGFILVLVLAIVIYVKVENARRRKKRRMLREQRAMEIAKERAEKERDRELRDWFF